MLDGGFVLRCYELCKTTKMLLLVVVTDLGEGILESLGYISSVDATLLKCRLRRRLWHVNSDGWPTRNHKISSPQQRYFHQSTSPQFNFENRLDSLKMALLLLLEILFTSVERIVKPLLSCLLPKMLPTPSLKPVKKYIHMLLKCPALEISKDLAIEIADNFIGTAPTSSQSMILQLQSAWK